MKISFRPVTRRGNLSTISSLHDPPWLVSLWLLPENCCHNYPAGRELVGRNTLTPKLKFRGKNFCPSQGDLGAHDFGDGRFRKTWRKKENHVHFRHIKMKLNAVVHGPWIKRDGRYDVKILQPKHRIPFSKPGSIPILELSAAGLAVDVRQTARCSKSTDWAAVVWTDSAMVLH